MSLDTRHLNFRNAYRTHLNNPGMDWREAETAFLRSRRLGIHGAYRAARPRTLVEYQWDLKQFFDFLRTRQAFDNMVKNLKNFQEAKATRKALAARV
jgi:hypothetical protein